MGKYNTIYNDLDNTTLHSLFSSENWNKMNGEQRLGACQEVENRLAAERGTEPREVICSEMEGCTYGYQYGNTIELNSSLLNDGVFHVEYKDFDGNTQMRTVPVNSPSWEVFDTVNHEDMHGYWEDMGIMPETYIQFDTDANLYRIQGCEKSAFEAGERNTFAAIKDIEESLGIKDPEALVYLDAHSENSFQESLEEAKLLYNDNDIEDTLNSYIANTDLGITPANASPSYEAIDDLYYQQCVENYLNSEQTETEESTQIISTSQSSELVEDGSGIFNDFSQSNVSGYSAVLEDDGAVIQSSEDYSAEADGAGISSSASYDGAQLSGESSSSYDAGDGGEDRGIE